MLTSRTARRRAISLTLVLTFSLLGLSEVQRADASGGESKAEAKSGDSLVATAHEFATSLPELDKAQEILAFIEAFNVATAATEGVATSHSAPRSLFAELTDQSLYTDEIYQENFERLVLESGRILGGVTTEDFPHCVAVGSSSRWCCTGTLIAPDRVVTAGHCSPTCVDRIFVGEDVEGNGQTIQVQHAIRHPAYLGSPHYENDLTILILEAPVSGVTPVALARSETIDTARSVRLVGYGNTNTAGTQGYGKRRMVDVAVASTDCQPDEVGVRYGCHPDLEIVAGEPTLDRDSCRGDSGGPAYVEVGGQWRLAGATSRAVQGSTRVCGDGGIYPRLDRYSDWLMTAAPPQ